MADILISKFTTQIPRVGATPATPGFAESEGQDPVAPSGSPLVYTPVTIGSPANGLSIDGSQVLTIGLASTSDNGALSSTDWNTFNGKENAITAGTTAQYWRGDKTFQDFATAVSASVLTGYTVGANTALADTDTILQAFGKVQGQINARISGTIASGQVAFGTGVNTVGGDSGLVWDNSTKELRIIGNNDYRNLILSRASSLNTAQRVSVNYPNFANNNFIGLISGADTTGTSADVIIGLNTGGGFSPNTISFRTASTYNSAGSERLRITNTGRVLIGANTNVTGVSSESRDLQVVSVNNTTTSQGFGIYSFQTAGISPRFDFNISKNSSLNGQTAPLTNEGIGIIRFNASDGTQFIEGSRISSIVESSITNGSVPAFLSFWTREAGQAILEKARITSTGQLWIGTTSGTNTLDVNGTARIRTISNLGSAATSVLVPSATGVVSLRTLAEFASDAGLTNFWTLTGSDIFRNSAVAIGRTTIPTNATFAVQSLSATGTSKFIQILNNSGSELLSLRQDSQLQLTGVLSIGTVPVSNISALFRSQTDTNASVGLRVQNQSGTTLFTVDGNSVAQFPSTVVGFYDTPISNFAITVKSQSAGGGIIYCKNSGGTVVWDLINDGTIRSAVGASFGRYGSPTARVEIRGIGTTTNTTLLLEDSGGTDNAIFLDNGQIRFLRLPTSSAGLAAGSLWNNGGVINIV